MPKVNLNPDRKKQRMEFRRNLVESKMRMRGIRSQYDMETRVGKPQGWLSKRFTFAVCWSADDFELLDKVLRFSSEELAQLVRGKS